MKGSFDGQVLAAPRPQALLPERPLEAPPSADGLTEVVIADFQNQSYRLDGEAVDIADLFQEIPYTEGFFPWDPVTDIVPGVGFVNRGPMRGPCVSPGVLARLGKSWTTVLDYEVMQGSGNTQPALYHVAPANLDYNPEWEYDHSLYFGREWALDFHPNTTTAQTAHGPAGIQRSAVRFDKSGLAFSTNGRSALLTGPVPDFAPSLIGCAIGLHRVDRMVAAGASITLKCVRLMSLATPEQLPALSTIPGVAPVPHSPYTTPDHPLRNKPDRLAACGRQFASRSVSRLVRWFRSAR